MCFTPLWLLHSIISVKQTSKLRLYPVWKCCCRANPQSQCITNSHICTLPKLALWHIRISQTGNYSISSSYSHWICVSCLLLRFSWKTAVLNVSQPQYVGADVPSGGLAVWTIWYTHHRWHKNCFSQERIIRQVLICPINTLHEHIILKNTNRFFLYFFISPWNINHFWIVNSQAGNISSLG